MSTNPHVYNQRTVSIATGQSQSAAFDKGPHTIAGILVPAAFTGTSITFLVSDKEDGTFVPLHDSTGTEVAATVATSRGVGLTEAQQRALQAFRFVKVRSGTTATPSNQAQDVTVVLTVVDI